MQWTNPMRSVVSGGYGGSPEDTTEDPSGAWLMEKTSAATVGRPVRECSVDSLGTSDKSGREKGRETLT